MKGKTIAYFASTFFVPLKFRILARSNVNFLHFARHTVQKMLNTQVNLRFPLKILSIRDYMTKRCLGKQKS